MSRMSRHQQPSHHYGWLLFFVMVTVVVMCVAIWYVTPNITYDHTPDHYYLENAAAPVEVKEPDIKNEVSDTLITEITKVIYHLHYTKCEHSKLIPREQGNKDLIGLNQEQLENLFPAYTIEKFSTDQVILSRYEEAFCQDCQDYVFFSIKDGYIALFYGKARPDAPIKLITDIPIAKFTKAQQQKLLSGITVENIEAEINAILEG